MSRQVIEEFVTQLPLDQEAKQRLRGLTPQNYVGLAPELVKQFIPGRKSVNPMVQTFGFFEKEDRKNPKPQ